MSATMASQAGGPVLLTTTTPSAAYMTPATYQHTLGQTLSLASNPAALGTYESRRAQACGLIAAVGAKIGLPQRTIDTAFVVWQKGSLQIGAPPGTAGQQVAQASLFLACKLNDTPKKAREIILASYPLRYPELVKPSSNASSSSTAMSRLRDMALSNVGETDVDTHMLDAERSKMLSLEKQLLDAVGYDFQIRHGVESVSRGVLKLGRVWQVSKDFVQSAWRIASDIHRTSAPLFYPALTLSLAALLTAALLCPPSASDAYSKSAATVRALFKLPIDEHRTGSDSRDGPEQGGAGHDQSGENGTPALASDKANGHTRGNDLQAIASAWLKDDSLEEELRTYSEEVEEVVHGLLDSYIASAGLVISHQQQQQQQQQQFGGSIGASQSLASSPSSPLNNSVSPSSPSEYPLTNKKLTGLAGVSGSTSSPSASSSASASSTAALKLPSYASNPPPLGVISWLKSHSPPIAKAPHEVKGAQQFVKDLTDAKIQLRGVEDRRAQSLRLAQGDENEDEGPAQKKRRRRQRRREEIDREKSSVQVLRTQVVTGEGAESAKPDGTEVATATVPAATPLPPGAMPPPPGPHPTLGSVGSSGVGLASSTNTAVNSLSTTTTIPTSKMAKTTRFLF